VGLVPRAGQRRRGLVVDIDDLNIDNLKKRARGLVHPKCKAFLALGRDNPLRFSMAITYLRKKAAV
jgi:hypothetical protein